MGRSRECFSTLGNRQMCAQRQYERASKWTSEPFPRKRRAATKAGQAELRFRRNQDAIQAGELVKGVQRQNTLLCCLWPIDYFYSQHFHARVEDSGEAERCFRRETAFRDEPEHPRSAATLALRFCRKCSASTRETCPERSGGWMPLARKRVRGKDGTSSPRISSQWPGARGALRQYDSEISLIGKHRFVG
jgi:hypothetical protein